MVKILEIEKDNITESVYNPHPTKNENENVNNDDDGENSSPTRAEIHLPYFKQGDDCCRCIVMNEDGTQNVHRTLQNHINLLQYTVEKLQEIKNLIPEDTDLELYGDTHYISISGNTDDIQSLIQAGLANAEDWSENEEENPDDYDNYDEEEECNEISDKETDLETIVESVSDSVSVRIENKEKEKESVIN
jgi:hypothetical protein